MTKTLNNIKLLLNELNRIGVLDALTRIDQFYDDIKFPQFSANIHTLNTDGHATENADSSGVSFISDEIALIKCLSEAAERFCLGSYKNNQIIYSSYYSLKSEAIDPFLYTGKIEDRSKEVGWISGVNLSKSSRCLIPAQLVFYNYILKHGELDFNQPAVSTGGAGGFDKSSVLLNGIYEVIERDAFMTAYLNTISLPRINLEHIDNKIIQDILKACDRYSLDLYVLDATNDLQIPSYISIILDKTGFGAPVTLGAKTGFRKENVILGSIMEALMLRTWMRRLINQGVRSDERNTITLRAIKWSSTEKIRDLNFLLTGCKSKKNLHSFTGSKEKELIKVKRYVESCNYNIYYVDITHPVFRKIKYSAYKVVIPGLQPLYLDEKDKKYIDRKRLEVVSKFFGKKDLNINPIPHPFL